MRFHIAPDFTHIVLKFPPHRLEGIPNCKIRVRVGFIFSRTLAHDKFTARNDEKDFDFEDISLSFVAMRKL